MAFLSEHSRRRPLGTLLSSSFKRKASSFLVSWFPGLELVPALYLPTSHLFGNAAVRTRSGYKPLGLFSLSSSLATSWVFTAWLNLADVEQSWLLVPLQASVSSLIAGPCYPLASQQSLSGGSITSDSTSADHSQPRALPKVTTSLQISKQSIRL